MNKKTVYLLILISIVGFCLRFYKVGDIPNGLTWDEAAIGYNAYSISKNLRDEHGEFLPMVFKSFGDFKPPVYIYMTAPIVRIFGMTELTTRLLSVIAGTATISAIYFLVFEISKNQKWSLLSALFLAFSPWHIFYSRGAWETNLMTLFLVIGILGIIRSSNNKSGLWWGLMSLFLGMMTYQAGKLYVPLILVSLFICGYIKLGKLFTEKKSMFVWCVFGALSAILLGLNLFTSAGNRLNRLSIFNYKPDLVEENKKYDGENSVFHTMADLRVRLVSSRYLTHYSTDFLFIDNKPTDRGHLPKLGTMYWIDALFLLVGFFVLLDERDRKAKMLVVVLLFFSAIPGALTLAEFSSTRNLFMIIPLSIIGALGALWLAQHSRLIFVCATFLWVFCVIYFIDIFMIHSSVVLGKEFNIGYKKVFESLSATHPSRAVVTDVYGQPYIYYLFYGKVDPVWYQTQGEYRERGIDVGLVGRVGDVEFRQFDLSEIKRSTDAFFAGGTGNFIGGNVNDLDNIEYSDEVSVDGQEIMFKIVKTR